MARFMRYLTCQYKLRGIVSAAFTVFIKYKPVTCGKIGREHHVTGDDYRCVIRINRFIRIILRNISCIIRMYIPAQQRVVVIQGEVL